MAYKCYKGSTLLPKICKGGTLVKKVYKGSQMIWRAYDPTPITFRPSNNFQTYIVPSGVGHLQVDCIASRGYTEGSRLGGNGGRVQCRLTVTSGQTLYIYIGNIPSEKAVNIYNASDIRTNNAGLTNITSLQSRLIVAGGGGNASSDSNGGNGGNLTGASGGGVSYQTQASGGTQTRGGIASARSGGNTDGWAPGTNGNFGLGGAGGDGWMYNVRRLAGAGGAGWYGGGGGSVYDINKIGISYAPGGGGSSYTHPSLCTNVVHTQGFNNGNGYIILTPMD